MAEHKNSAGILERTDSKFGDTGPSEEKQRSRSNIRENLRPTSRSNEKYRDLAYFTRTSKYLEWGVLLAVVLYILTTKLSEIYSPNAEHLYRQRLTHNITARTMELDIKLQKPDPNIYLIWTTAPETFRIRNTKVIDSYLYQHPNSKVIIFATSLDNGTFTHYAQAGYDVTVQLLDDDFIRSLGVECGGEAWTADLNKWKIGPFYYSHITDFIRFCVLYRFGGIYSDFDAITLKRINQHANFIGKDSSGAGGGCGWCLAGGDLYLAPGVMGTERGHLLPYTAFQIGFGEVYDPEIFNSVGPMAVTKAYRRLLATSGAGSRSDRTATRNPREMNLYEQHVLYPFGYKTSGEVFLPTQDPDARLQRITGKSISLHLFGHQTKNLEVDDDSILMAAFKKLSVVDGKTTTDSFYNLVAPRYLGVRFGVSHIEDIRIIAAKSSYKDSSSSVLEVELKTHFGKLRVGGDSNNWAMTLKYVFSSPRHANAVLSKLIYMPRHGNHMEKDVIEIRFSADKDIQIRKVAVYNVEKLVTIIVKTVGRVEKVFALVSSARKLYPGIHIIVSDDAEHLVESGGFKKSFYYMPLPHDAGLSAGRNRMVEQVKTTYFLTLDDDFVLDENSKIEALIHALETPPDVAMREKHAYPNWRGTFDIAAGKNPVDEQRWGLDFSGLMSVEGGVLRLKNGTYGPQPHEGCHHVDFVPNIFLGRTSVFQKEIQWDEQLKLGEHEDFFLRSKELGLGTLTCPHVSFNHDQVHHWLKQTKYDLLRNRVYDFWKLALMKHGARQLESFGNIMMDLIVPPKVKRVITSLVLSQSAIITWDQGKNSNATSYRIMQSFAEGISNENDLTPVNGNEGENFIPSRSRFRTTSILANNLEPGKSYIFRVFAGNRFEFEDDGADLFIKTLTKREEQALNLLKNPSFEEGHFQFNHSVGATFHIVESMYREDLTEYDKQVERNRLSRASRLSRERGRSSAGLAHRYHSFQNDPQSSAFDSNSFPGSAPLGVPEEKRRILIHELCRTGNFCGRAQIPTRSYQSNSMTVNEIVQSVDGQRLQIDGERMLVFTAWSKIERLFHPETSWRAELRVWFNQNPKEKLNDLGWIKAASPHMVEVAYFDTGFQEWQQSLIIMCLSPWATVARVDVVGILETFRGSVYWDDWLLLEKTGSEF